MADTFTFRGVEYPYHEHDSELAVTVPIIQAAIDAADGVVLQVGTVLTGPPSVRWSDFDTEDFGGDYALVVSANGIQHTDGPAAVVLKLMSRLTPGGRLLLAAPLGFNGVLDRMLNPAAIHGTIGFLAIQGDEWVEVDYRQARQCPYRKPSRGARAVAIVEWQKAEAVADESADEGAE